MKRTLLAALILAAVPMQTSAQPAVIAELVAMTGECKKLITMGKDQTENCLPILFNKTYTNRRTAIMAVLPNAIWSFGGPLTARSQLSETSRVVSVDETVINLGDGIPPASAKAVGTCTSTLDAETNVVTFQCRSGSGASASELLFESDGSPVKSLTP